MIERLFASAWSDHFPPFPRKGMSGACVVLAVAFLMVFADYAPAAVPAPERQVLIDLYVSSNGGGWSQNAGWCTGACPASGVPTFNAIGTECTWYGVSCDSTQSHVLAIGLSNNNLTGSLPSLAALTSLQFFAVASNNLSGALPSLTSLAQLVEFHADANQFSGSIPSLTGLTALGDFSVTNNQLGGTLPSLSGSTNLYNFAVTGNQLTGALPSLAGLTNLQSFDAGRNQFNGGVPALNGLSALLDLSLRQNQLSGSIPALSGPTGIYHVDVGGNRLSGPVPLAPASLSTPLAYWPSALCANLLSTTPSSNDASWNAATGATPWYATPFANNRCDDIFYNSFETSP